MKFNYYYGTEADQFLFIRIQKALLLDKTFSTLSLQAKMLYGILLDRMGLSMKNGWCDKENRISLFIKYLKFRKIWDLPKIKQLNI